MNPQVPLAGRTVLVTGGARRIGAAIVRHLAALGARMVIHHHESGEQARVLAGELSGAGMASGEARTAQTPAGELSGGGAAGGETWTAQMPGDHPPAGCLCLGADLARPEAPAELLAAAEAAGAPPDAVVHAAASFLRRGLAETTAEDWDRVMALNLRSTFLLAQELGRRWSGGGGDLVVIGDAGGLELWPGYFAHSVAKAALIPLVKALAKALAPGIRVNGVIPGPVLPPAGTPEEELARLRERTLLKRIGDPLHVAQAVAFLLTCDYATGSWVEVTGGSQLWRGRP